jgi:glycosyltransferase involved in cell wall biosynthesis
VLINAGPWLAVPPRAEGGVENALADLIAGLRRRGVRVVLATVGESAIEVDEKVWRFDVGQYPRVTNRPYNKVAGIPHAHMLQVAARLQEGDIDLVHDHLEVVGPSTYVMMAESCPPVLHTLHWPLDRHSDFYATFDGRGRIHFSAVSESQLAGAEPNLRRQAVGVVPAGLDPSTFPFQPVKEPYFVVLGRVAEAKGQDIAARICSRHGQELVLAGPIAGISSPDRLLATIQGSTDVRSQPAVRFYLERVLPHVDGRLIRWVGAPDGMAKRSLLARARALIMPVRWDEPFGLVVIEAMACGTPVIAMRRGNLPAIVEPGVNGFLADDEDELAGYLDRAHEIDPAACRRTVEERFSADVMVARYLDLYERVTGAGAWPETRLA